MAEGKQAMPQEDPRRKSSYDFLLMILGSAFLVVLAFQLLFPRATDASSAPTKGEILIGEVIVGRY